MVLPGSEERTEAWDVRVKADLRVRRVVLGRKETLARTALRVLTDRRDRLAQRDSEAWWDSLDSEERAACWDFLVLLVHQENQDLPELRGAKVQPVGSVYPDPQDPEEMLGHRASPEKRDPQGKTVLWARGETEETVVRRVWLVFRGLRGRRVRWE